MVFNENKNLGPCSAYNMREYRFSLTDILPYVRRFCPYPGEHGSEKTRISCIFYEVISVVITLNEFVLVSFYLAKFNN